MGRPVADVSGQRFGRLLVVRRDGFRGKNAAWLCACDCGNSITVAGGALKAGTQSCGCLAREVHSEGLRARNTTHGLSRTRTYRAWASMIARCTYPPHKHFMHYGGRGIEVCKEWQSPHGFAAFFRDMGEAPIGLSLDRRDNDGNYNKANCRWATTKEQSLNTSRNLLFSVAGEMMTAAQMASIAGVKENTMRWRLARWSPEKALHFKAS